jgi:hypothetical protein
MPPLPVPSHAIVPFRFPSNAMSGFFRFIKTAGSVVKRVGNLVETFLWVWNAAKRCYEWVKNRDWAWAK